MYQGIPLTCLSNYLTCFFLLLRFFYSTYFLNFSFHYGFIFAINFHWRVRLDWFPESLLYYNLVLYSTKYNSILKIYFFLIICERVDIAYVNPGVGGILKWNQMPWS